jgi:tyrosine-protein phosphatase YwqE
MPIDAAAEYLMDEGFADKIEAGNLLTLGDNYVLVEMSFISPPPNAEQLLFQLQTKGYRPIMAHPERYSYYGSDLAKYERLKERGCLLQLNLLSLSGYYGPDVRRTATKMLKAGLFDLAGTDLHHERHAEALQALMEDSRAVELLEGYAWRNKELFGVLSKN